MQRNATQQFGEERPRTLQICLVAESKTGYYGVCLSNPGRPKPYQAQVRSGGKKVHLGSFATAEELTQLRHRNCSWGGTSFREPLVFLPRSSTPLHYPLKKPLRLVSSLVLNGLTKYSRGSARLLHETDNDEQ